MENRNYPVGTPVIVKGLSGEIVSESFSPEGTRYVQVRHGDHYQWHNSRHVISEDDLDTAIWNAQPEHAR